MFDFIWAAIPLAPFAIGGLAIWTHHKRKTLELEVELTKARAMERPQVSDKLEQRVRTLERIITDGRGRDDLAQQIEDLREKQLS
ncbi:MAG: hypothetical protein ACT6R2_09120 [Blastomonas fulva]|jgi:hypothetical protein|uniref:Envelope stress response membrane protein PspB n=1 Tax=Blastomonas fulva TaxID=1550728 RepID=A0ABM6M7N3_9SPHN|nr:MULTISPECIES: hypothetical protein [Blastomonas]AOG00393.1 hypothetical protein BSY18_429 [Blastomonas sp. RAC04]ASR51985.1 hypothetical protein B5J99_11375 [Blastomonas fulva]KPF73393.1 hypothetical protein IP68_16425 [Blastomonas sp. AAP25]MCO5794221.1 hypothetical protein [Blastomonas sp.]MDK2755690.1 hypothetical protein [Blastomonas fulva]